MALGGMVMRCASAGGWSMPGGLSIAAGTQNVVAGTFPTSRDKGTLITGGSWSHPIALVRHTPVSPARATVYGAVQDGSRPKKATSFVPASESLGTGKAGPNMSESRGCFSFDSTAS